MATRENSRRKYRVHFTAPALSVLVVLATACGTVPTTSATESVPAEEELAVPTTPMDQPTESIARVESEAQLRSPRAFIGGVALDWQQQPLSGVIVVLEHSPNMRGKFTPVPDGAAILSPDNRNNPLVTGDDGRFSWDALSGWYRIRASKPGCVDFDSYGESPEFLSAVFEHLPSLGFDATVTLDCRPRDHTEPTIIITSRPDEIINATTASIEFEINDDQGFVAAFCLSEQDQWLEASTPLEPCTSPFTVSGLADGPYSFAIIAVDEQGNSVFEFVDFTVAT